MAKSEYYVCVFKDIMVRMRDGVRLATDVYRPARDEEPVHGKFPTILERTPYNKNDPERIKNAWQYFCKRGYAAVLQDVRGRYGSKGNFYTLVNEPDDGYDTIEWIASQPWSDRKVGMIDTSYGAWVQGAAASANPPHLSAIFHNQGGFNAHHHSVRHGGALETRWMAYSFFMAASSKEAEANQQIFDALMRNKASEYLVRLPLKMGATHLSLVSSYEKFVFDLACKGDYDGYWVQKGFNHQEHLYRYAEISVYYAGGWYDSYTLSNAEIFSASMKKKRGPVKMIIGPWTHGDLTWRVTYAGDVDFGADATVDYDKLRLMV